jgi:hypothetical protein
MKRGDQVKQILPAAVEGVVAGFALDQETGKVIALVESTDPDGTVHSRYFSQDDLEVIVA